LELFVLAMMFLRKRAARFLPAYEIRGQRRRKKAG
jgi:hypothetical protein